VKSKFILRNDTIKYRAFAALSELSTDGEPWEVIIRPYHKNRSREQNDFLWAMHGAASEELGHSTDDLHQYCCRMFLGRREISVGGRIPIVVNNSTTHGPNGGKLTVAEMTKFIMEVTNLYSSLGVKLDKVYGEAKESTGS